MISLETINPSNPLAFLAIILLGGIIGDNVFIILGFMMSQDSSRIWVYYPLLFLGMVTADYLFYLIGRSKSFEKIKNVKIIGKFFDRVDGAIDFITGNHLILAFFYCKFITGAKLLVNIYLGKKGISKKRFIVMTLIAALIWSSFAFMIGYISGKGFTMVLSLFESLSLAVLFLVLVLIIFFKFIRKTKEYIHKKYVP